MYTDTLAVSCIDLCPPLLLSDFDFKMPSFCGVVNCGNRANRDRKSFFRLPMIPKRVSEARKKLIAVRRRKWLLALRRADLTERKIKYLRICEDHFISSKPSALEDVDHPDWVPSKCMGYKTPNSDDSFLERFKRRGNRKKRILDDIDQDGDAVNREDLDGDTQGEVGKPSNGSQHPDYVPSLSRESSEKPLPPLLQLHNYLLHAIQQSVLREKIKQSTARKTFPHSKNNILKPEDFSCPLSPENSLENDQVHLTRSIAQDARDNSDILEETDDNEEAKQNIVRKKRKIREESSSSEREVSNVSSSSAKKYHGSTTEKKSHSNSSSVKKVQNTSVSQKKNQITPLQKKKHSSASSEKVLHDSSSQKKVNNSLSSEIEPENSLLLKELPQKNSSLSEKERNNSSSSEKELKSSSSEKDMNSSSDIESKKESHKASSISDIPDNVPALNSLDREDIFGQYVASELRALRNNPLIYLQTKQSILESITSANFELLNPDS